MSQIHPSVFIDESAVIGEDVCIGPHVVIGPRVMIGKGSVVGASVYLESDIQLGTDCHVSAHVKLGGDPQHNTWQPVASNILIGNAVHLGAHVTIHRPLKEHAATQIGDNAILNEGSHVAHDCFLGAGVVLGNSVQLGGFTVIGEGASIGAQCPVHQFVHIGRFSKVEPFSGISQDIPPFSLTQGDSAWFSMTLYEAGALLAGLPQESLDRLRRAFKILWFSRNNMTQGVQLIHDDQGFYQAFSKGFLPQSQKKLSEGEPFLHPFFPDYFLDPAVQELIGFAQDSRRGIRQPDG
jgi:UDP-N-acetylglucosamine acyltransferase